MLYMMMQKGANNTFYVKVGVTRNSVKSRYSQYKTHNPCAFLRSSCAGVNAAENSCHKTLSKIGERISGTEWFIVSEEVYTTLYEQGMRYFYPKHSPIYFHDKAVI